MDDTPLNTFVDETRLAWSSPGRSMVSVVSRSLAALLRSPHTAWSDLRRDRPANLELHRDDEGFILLAHAEQQGLYRPPHDHGRSWVVYGVLEGALEVRTYTRLDDGFGDHLVLKDTEILRAGDVQAYLPGEIHDTRCISPNALLLRFTERDLKADAAYPVTRYVDRGGIWMPPVAA